MNHYPDDPPKVSLWERFLNWWNWRDEALLSVQTDTITIRAGLAGMQALILKEFDHMAEREDQAWAKQAEDVQAVKDGWDALVASNTAKDQKIADLTAALETAGDDVQAQVQAALDTDSDADAAKVEAANTALEALVNPPAPVDDNPPADDGGE